MITKVENIKKKFPPKTKIKLLHMEDTQAPPDGTIGTVLFVDDMGTIHIAWNNGSSLGVICGVDKFTKI